MQIQQMVAASLAIVLFAACYVFIEYVMDYSLFWNCSFKWECARVAVYEHVPLGQYDASKSPREIINLNMKKYKMAITEAAKEVNIFFSQ